MTVAPRTAPLSFATLEEAEAALRENGLRMTSPRHLVLEALFEAEGPVSAEDLANTLRLDPASVYRNLETLERQGLIRHMHLGHGPGLYLLVGHGEREYVYCERCGAVTTLEPDQLDPVREQVRRISGYEARFSHFPIVGLCVECARAQSLTHS